MSYAVFSSSVHNDKFLEVVGDRSSHHGSDADADADADEFPLEVKARCAPEGYIPSHIAATVALQARLSIDEMNTSSRFLVPEEDRSRDVAQFLKKEIVLGELLASGCFSDVYEIRSFRQCDQYSRSLTNMQESARTKMLADSESYCLDPSDNSLCSSSTGSVSAINPIEEDRTIRSAPPQFNTSNKYVVKHLRSRLLGNLETFTVGAADLAREAQMLASIQHPNIISIRGWSSHGTSGYESGHHDGYFLILDRLYETLHERNQAWKKKVKKFTLSSISTIKQKRQQLVGDCLKVYVDIAGALEYLHERNVIYRDLKPENLAFDKEGNIQLFDFGLAKEIIEDTKDNEEGKNKFGSCSPRDDSAIDEVYELTGGTGSMRYMAPEVGMYLPYNLKADVYGFAVMLFESLSLRIPYEGYTPETMREKVFENGVRPKLFSGDSRLPSDVLKIITDGWSPDPSQRPSMKKIHIVLRKVIEKQEKSCTPPVTSNRPGLRRGPSLVSFRQKSSNILSAKSDHRDTGPISRTTKIQSKGTTNRRAGLTKRRSCGF